MSPALHSPHPGKSRSVAFVLLWLLSFFSVSACDEQPPPSQPPIVENPDLAEAIVIVVDDLHRQLGPAAASSRTAVIDPLLDGRTGQQTMAASDVQLKFGEAFGSLPSVQLLEFHAHEATDAKFIVSGTLTALEEVDRYRLMIALSDRQSRIVVAQGVISFVQEGLDSSPTPFYGDSPSLVRDRSVDGYLKTVETPAGQPADELYLEQVPTSALLSDALEAYNDQRWQEALQLYAAASARPDGQQLRTFNGTYLCQLQLGRLDLAEEAFSKIVALGLATNNLAVKLLFRPGGTEFWPDPTVNRVYPMWLRQIAVAAGSADSCLEIVGHTSRSGSESVNDRLSLARARAIRGQLAQESAGLSRKLRVRGVGYRENLVGSGTDDASDALDRRVEFRVIDCS